MIAELIATQLNIKMCLHVRFQLDMFEIQV